MTQQITIRVPAKELEEWRLKIKELSDRLGMRIALSELVRQGVPKAIEELESRINEHAVNFVGGTETSVLILFF
ncbi:hypothetical protein [Caldicellulosiruptor bescii]|uniref:hypothetical protein n=1 Tax=Caldicellulosiruptor bescii TaxID=31899 RepID=UPI000B499B19|nr:hypothetical protein [Caldicellulosiruptor bescii]SMR98654.1 hypothetical protein SAMN05216182_2864 [Caldicellulosiruptor bescii]